MLVLAGGWEIGTSELKNAIDCCIKAYEDEVGQARGCTRPTRYLQKDEGGLAVLAFPGTNPDVKEDVRCDARFRLRPLCSIKIEAFASLTKEQAHEGFLDRLEDLVLARDSGGRPFEKALPRALAQLIRDGKKILLVGHSLGGAVAILTAIWLLQCCHGSVSPPLHIPHCHHVLSEESKCNV